MRPSVVGLLGLIAAGISGGSGVSAAEAPAAESGGLEEVVVAATKRSENLQDVPMAVAAITPAQLAKQGVFETSDLNHAMPNLQVSSPYGQQQPNFSVRGIGVGTEFNANAASPVGVYVDEVYQAFRSSHGQQLYDLEQVEVVRGPQGTLYGRNTTGGAINFITRQPKLGETTGDLTIGYGNYSRRNVEGAFETTPIPGKLGFRIAGTFVNENPYFRNVLPSGLNTSAAGGASGLNRDTGFSMGGDKSYGWRAIVRFAPTDAIDLSLKGYGALALGGSETTFPFGQTKGTDTIDYTNPNFLLSPLFQALAPAGLLPASYSRSGNGLTDSEVQLDSNGRATTRADGAVFTAHLRLSDTLKLVAISGIDSGEYGQDPYTDCDGTPLSLCSIGYHSNFHAFNQDLRLDWADGPIKVIGGAYYGHDSVTSNNHPTFFGVLSDVTAAVGLPSSYFNPAGGLAAALPPGALPTPIRATQHFRQDRDSIAIYSEGSYQLLDALKLTAGLRYTADRNHFKDGMAVYYDDSGAPRLITVSDYTVGGAYAPYLLQPVGAAPASAGPMPGGLQRYGKSNKLSGRFIADYKLAEQVMVYASYSRGYRAGTFNGLAYGSANQVYFVQPEVVDALEFGFKSRFLDNRLQINGAVFHDKYQGQQGQVVDVTATANLVSLNGKIDGLELEIEFAATDALRLNASLGLLHSKYDSAVCPAGGVSGFPAQAGNCVQSAAGSVSVGGNPFPYAANSSANLGFDWDVINLREGKVALHADTAYTGRYYYDAFKDYSRGPLTSIATGDFTNGDGNYWTVNSRLTYNIDRYSISAWGKNLTDRVYYPFGISIENLFGNGYRVHGQPRTFGVEVAMSF